MVEQQANVGGCPFTGLGSEAVGALLDPFGAEYLNDPYGVFKLARNDSRVYYSEDLDYWILTRYDDIKRIIRDTANFSADAANQPLQPFGPSVLEELGKVDFRPVRVLVDNDPPDHVRVRRQVNKAFNAQRLKLMEDPIRELTREHIDRFAASAEIDFVEGLAWPLPALVLFRLFGMPDSHLQVVKEGSADRVVLTTGRPSEEESRRAAGGLAAFYALCTQLITERLGDLRDDFPSDLIRAGEGQEGALNTRELVQVMYSILFAGHETTTSHLTHLIRRVLLEPGLWQRLRADRSLIPNVVEEVLRLEAPVINWRRRAKNDVEVGGVAIPAGSRLLLLLGSANHDEEFFSGAERFEPERENARQHLSFGFGSHLCLGAPLARLEGQIVLEEMVDRFESPSIPEQELEYTPSLLFRSAKALRLVL